MRNSDKHPKLHVLFFTFRSFLLCFCFSTLATIYFGSVYLWLASPTQIYHTDDSNDMSERFRHSDVVAWPPVACSGVQGWTLPKGRVGLEQKGWRIQLQWFQRLDGTSLKMSFTWEFI